MTDQRALIEECRRDCAELKRYPGNSLTEASLGRRVPALLSALEARDAEIARLREALSALRFHMTYSVEELAPATKIKSVIATLNGGLRMIDAALGAGDSRVGCNRVELEEGRFDA